MTYGYSTHNVAEDSAAVADRRFPPSGPGVGGGKEGSRSGTDGDRARLPHCRGRYITGCVDVGSKYMSEPCRRPGHDISADSGRH